MKKLFLFLFSILSTYSFAQKIDSLTIQSKILNTERKITVYTPWMYQNDTSRRFEVIYVFDAQSMDVFNMVSATMSLQNKNICPMIVVGIISSQRNRDLLPKNENPETAKRYGNRLGGADSLMHFISDEVAPLIDKNYRALPRKIAVGHSNGGTFITHCFLNKPQLFDAYISIDPNFEYDEMQLVKRLAAFDPQKTKGKKFYYTCKASSMGKEWDSAKQLAVAYFLTPEYQKDIVFVNEDYSKSENHLTVFQPGVLNGLKAYFNYQYFDVDKLIEYYGELNKQHLIKLTPQNTNQAGYNFYFSGNTPGALKILLWANKLFPEDYNLYDSIGEMYQALGNKTDALKYYRLCNKKIEEQKSSSEESDYKARKKNIEERFKSLKKE